MKWLHISDTHFDLINDGTATLRLRDNFFVYIKDHNIVVDEVFFTGDFRHAKNQINQDPDKVARESVNFLKDIAKAVGITNTDHIHIVPGNHDLKREVENSEIDLDEICKNYNGNFKESDKVKLRSRFEFFEKCIYLLENKIWENFKSGRLHRYKILDSYCIIYLNTAIACGQKKERGNLAIGSADLYEIIKELKSLDKKKTIFILSHHPMEAIKYNDMRIIKDMINELKMPTFWLCGDFHEIMENNTYDITEWATGCFKIDSMAQAGFFIGEFNPDVMSVNVEAYTGSKRGQWEYSESYTKLANDAIPARLRKLEYPHFFKIAEHYAMQGNYKEAIELAEKALNENLNDKIKANIELKLGFWYCWDDNNDKAIKILLSVIDKFITLNDMRHLALCYNYIGLVYDEMCKWSSSEFNYIQALKIYNSLKADTSDVFEFRKECYQCYANIGLMYYRWGQSTATSIYYGNAKKYYDIAFDFFFTNENKLQNDSAIFYNNYALFCDNQKNYSDAINLYKRALSIKSKTLGQWHISAARIYSNIGLAYYNISEYKESVYNCEMAVRIYEDHNQKECRDALRNLGTLAASKARLGEREEALNLLFKQLEIRLNLYGEDDTDVAQTYNNIGNILFQQENYIQAEIYLKKAFDIRYKKIPTHRYTIETMQKIASLYKIQRNTEEALKWYIKIKELQNEILGANHFDTLETEKIITEISSEE